MFIVEKFKITPRTRVAFLRVKHEQNVVKSPGSQISGLQRMSMSLLSQKASPGFVCKNPNYSAVKVEF